MDLSRGPNVKHIDTLNFALRGSSATQQRELTEVRQTMYKIASTKVSDLTSPKVTGEPVNVHVVEPIRSPEPDFDAMRKLIESAEQTKALSDPSRG